MDIMELESVMLRLSQKPRPMLSMDMVLGTALILWDMAMDILATLPRSQGRCSLWIWSWAPHLFFGTWLWTSWLLFPWPMLSMDMVLGTALILWDMAMDILATLPLADALYGYGLGHRTYSLGHGYGHLGYSSLGRCSLWIWSWAPHLFFGTWLWTSWLLFPWLWSWIWYWLWHLWIWKACC